MLRLPINDRRFLDSSENYSWNCYKWLQKTSSYLFSGNVYKAHNFWHSYKWHHLNHWRQAHLQKISLNLLVSTWELQLKVNNWIYNITQRLQLLECDCFKYSEINFSTFYCSKLWSSIKELNSWNASPYIKIHTHTIIFYLNGI